MKKLLFLLLLWPASLMAQTVTFDKPFYTTGDDISGTLLTGTDGVENSITATSMGAVSSGHFSLGSTTIPGYYPVTFSFSSSVENYCILVLPPGTDADPGTAPAIVLDQPADARYGLFLDKCIELSKEGGSYTAILDRVVTKYATAYPVQGPVTMVACIGVPVSGGNPIFVFTCKQGIQALAKDIGIFMLESLNEELLARGKIGQDDYDFYKSNIRLIQYAINFYTADGFMDTFSSIASATGTDTGNNLAYGASLTDQVIKKFQFVLKFKPH